MAYCSLSLKVESHFHHGARYKFHLAYSQDVTALNPLLNRPIMIHPHNQSPPNTLLNPFQRVPHHFPARRNRSSLVPQVLARSHSIHPFPKYLYIAPVSDFKHDKRVVSHPPTKCTPDLSAGAGLWKAAHAAKSSHFPACRNSGVGCGRKPQRHGVTFPTENDKTCECTHLFLWGAGN